MAISRVGWTWLYIVTIALGGGLAIGYSIGEVLHQSVDWRWGLVAGLTLLSGLTTMRMSAVPVSFSIAETVTFAVLLVAGPAAATLAVALDCLSVSVRLAWGGLAPRRFVFNLAAAPLAMWIAGHSLYGLADVRQLSSDHARFGWLLGPIAVAAAIYYFLNTGLIALAVALEERRPVIKVWRDNFLPLWLCFLGGSYAATLLAVFLRELNLPFLLLIAPLPIVQYATLRNWLARLDDRVRHLDQLKRQTEALNEAAARRQQAESALTGRDELFHAVFDNALDALVVLDDDRRFLDVNPAAHRLLGTRPGTSLPACLDELIDPLYVGDMGERWAAFLAAGEARGEIRLIGVDRKPRFVEFTQKAQVMPGRHLAVWRDVSERKGLEEQLRQSQKMETVGRLAGGVAHDFNNLLTAMMGYASLTFDRIEDPESREYLQEVVTAGERAAALTRQLLAFSRKQVLQPVVTDLDDVVSGVEKMLQRIVGENVKLKTVRTGNPWNVRVDRGQFEQVIVNLVLNARDAMPDGGTVTVSVSKTTVETTLAAWQVEELPPGQYLQLAVNDTGVGMTEDVRGQIFEPFFTTKEIGKGTGLGLATVYGIVQQSGGYISVTSTPERGATFTVSLPVVADGVGMTMDGAHPEGKAVGWETILLAEDEPAVRSLTRNALMRQGYRVIEAASGTEACELVEKQNIPIDLVLTDVVMPGISGPELVRRLRVTHPEIKAIYMSGYHDDALLRHHVRANEVPFLPKPFVPRRLIQIVHDTLAAGFQRPRTREGQIRPEDIVRPA
jgi:signal transduction histidine kinase